MHCVADVAHRYYTRIFSADDTTKLRWRCAWLNQSSAYADAARELLMAEALLVNPPFS
jgi:hypothetical protein